MKNYLVRISNVALMPLVIKALEMRGITLVNPTSKTKTDLRVLIINQTAVIISGEASNINTEAINDLEWLGDMMKPCKPTAPLKNTPRQVGSRNTEALLYLKQQVENARSMGYKLDQLSEVMGYSRSYVSSLINGHVKQSENTLYEKANQIKKLTREPK